MDFEVDILHVRSLRMNTSFEHLSLDIVPYFANAKCGEFTSLFLPIVATRRRMTHATALYQVYSYTVCALDV